MAVALHDVSEEIRHLFLAHGIDALQHRALAAKIADDENLVKNRRRDTGDTRNAFDPAEELLVAGYAGFVQSQQVDLRGGADNLRLNVFPESGRERQSDDQSHDARCDPQDGNG